MAALAKATRFSGVITNLSKLLTNLSLSATNISSKCIIPRVCSSQVSSIHTSSRKNGLMEFFDDEKNWAAKNVKVGRSWLKDELRLKSNEDLHKLWYILLKEKNMLLTMEHSCKQEYEYFPNPERIDKVEESMENLETVVRERNVAYHQLETGLSGERPARIVFNQIGLRHAYRSSQHIVPKFMNTSWKKKHIFNFKGSAVHKFLKLYREKLFLEKRQARRRQQLRVQEILRSHKDVDMDAIRHEYPEVDLEKIKHTKYDTGNFVRE